MERELDTKLIQSDGRFKVIEGYPPVGPNCCSACGSHRGTFIDFGLDVDYYGTVYLCLDNCFKEAMTQLGYLSPVDKERLHQELEDYKLSLNEAEEEIERLENAVDSLTNSRRWSSSGANSDDSGQDSRGLSGQDDSGSTGREEGSLQSTDEQRSGGLFRNDAIDPFDGLDI